MKKALILTSIMLIGLLFVGGCVPDKNKPPTVPSITFPSEVEKGTEVEMTAVSVDPNRDRVAYKVNFGTGFESDWSDYCESNQPYVFTHTYEEVGDYDIWGIAIDHKGALSDWSEPAVIKVLPRPPPNGHGTDRLYKMLYVCPWYTDHTGWTGLDEIREIGFNTYHTYSPLQWEQRGYFDTPEGRADCVRQMRRMCEELQKRDMYGAFNMPTREENLRPIIEVLGEFGDRFIAVTGEEPDGSVPPNPTLEEQKRLYDTIKEVAPDVIVAASFNGGDFCRAMNPDAFDMIFPNSYPYTWNKPAMPGTLAAETGKFEHPWWEISEWLDAWKVPMMKRCVPEKVKMINICQGFYNPRHHLPCIEEEWQFYFDRFGMNSFAVYPHGHGQGVDCICVMDDNRPDYGIKAQCRELMKKLDAMEAAKN